MLRAIVFKFLHIGVTVLLVLAFTLGAAGAQPAQAANTASRVSAGWMPFAGGLYDSQTNSIASLNGLVHIVARWKSVSANQAQVDIQVNLPAAGVTVTTDTGIPYIAAGAGQSSIFIPTDPIIPTDPVRVFVLSFGLAVVGSDRALPPNPIIPTDPLRPLRFALQFDLVFSAAGVLDFDASTVQAIPDFTEDIGGGKSAPPALPTRRRSLTWQKCGRRPQSTMM